MSFSGRHFRRSPVDLCFCNGNEPGPDDSDSERHQRGSTQNRSGREEFGKFVIFVRLLKIRLAEQIA